MMPRELSEEKLKFMEQRILGAIKKSNELKDFNEALKFIGALRRNKLGFVAFSYEEGLNSFESILISALESLANFCAELKQFRALGSLAQEILLEDTKDAIESEIAIEKIQQFQLYSLISQQQNIEIIDDEGEIVLEKITDKFIDATALAKSKIATPTPIDARNHYLLCLCFIENIKRFKVVFSGIDLQNEAEVKFIVASMEMFFEFHQLFDEALPLLKELMAKIPELFNEEDQQEQAINILSKILPGNEFDPVFNFATSLANTYIKRSGKGFDENFKTSINLAIKMMEKSGKDYYQENGVYQYCIDLLCKLTIEDIIQDCAGEEGFKGKYSEINACLEEYFLKSTRTSNNTPLYLLGYLTMKDESLLERILPLINRIPDEDMKMNCLAMLTGSMLENSGSDDKTKKRKDYKQVIKILQDHHFIDLTQKYDDLFINLIVAKILTEAPLSIEEIKRIDNIASNEINHLSTLASLFCYCGDFERAKKYSNAVLEHPSVDLEIGFTTLIQFRDKFVYMQKTLGDDLDAVANTIELYEKFLKLDYIKKSEEYKDGVLNSLFKLSIILGDEGKASNYAKMLSNHERNNDVKKYLEFLETNPDVEKAEKLERLRQTTRFLSKDEELQLVTAAYILENKKTFLKQETGAIDVEGAAARQATEKKIYVNGEEIDLGKCHKIEDVSNGVFYLYCNPKALSKSGEYRDQFEDALRKEKFTGKSKENGVKHVQGNVYELKINDDPRILGFKCSAKDQDGNTVNLIYFSKYCGKAHIYSEGMRASSQYNDILKALENNAKAAKVNFVEPLHSGIAAISADKLKGKEKSK